MMMMIIIIVVIIINIIIIIRPSCATQSSKKDDRSSEKASGQRPSGFPPEPWRLWRLLAALSWLRDAKTGVVKQRLAVFLAVFVVLVWLTTIITMIWCDAAAADDVADCCLKRDDRATLIH